MRFSLRSLVSKVFNIALYCLWLVSALILISPFISPSTWWVTALLPTFIPLVVLANVVISLYAYFTKSLKKYFVSIVLSAVSIFFVLSVFSVNGLFGKKEPNPLKVLSFNVSFFHTRGDYSEAYEDPKLNQPAVKMVDWLDDVDADIICLQEFYNDDASGIFNSIEKIARDGLYQYSFINNPQVIKERKRGLITFSKYPIVGGEEIFLDDNRYNGASYVDIVIDRDTIRVFNVHLQSAEFTSMNAGKVKNQRGWTGLVAEILTRLKSTAVKREQQMNQVLEAINNSPYEVLVCGDFNATPNTFVYRKIRRNLNNAYGAAGVGLGATYTQAMPLPVRIDNQFYSDGFKAQQFNINREIDYSDHYPIMTHYQMKDDN